MKYKSVTDICYVVSVMLFITLFPLAIYGIWWEESKPFLTALVLCVGIAIAGRLMDDWHTKG